MKIQFLNRIFEPKMELLTVERRKLHEQKLCGMHTSRIYIYQKRGSQASNMNTESKEYTERFSSEILQKKIT
jgi:hypothetical protein